jgi:S1-C subfamily serine protease
MKVAFRHLPIILTATALTFCGCASDSQTFIGPSGEIKNCASTSQAQGLGGIFLAHNRFTRCVDDIKAHGYKEIEVVGSIGITLYSSEVIGSKVMKVYDNSPAAKAGIVRGDIIVAINGNHSVQRHDFDTVYGDIGSPVDVTVFRDGKETSYTLVRAKFNYSRVLEDVTY